MSDDDELDVEKLARSTSGGFDRLLIEIEPFAECKHDLTSWYDAMVIVRAGAIEIVCAAGGRCPFRCGDMLRLPVSARSLRNPTAEPARLFVISRRTAEVRD